jgi:tRNA(Arg) A34 adenosine deaminase TadA
MELRDLELLATAVEVAASARAAGNHPFGALIADPDGAVLLTAENTVETESDCTGHAETNLVRLASRELTTSARAAATLYTSTQPCAMCAGAIYWSGIRRVVYAFGEDELFAFTGADPRNPTIRHDCRQVFAGGTVPTAVIGPAPVGSAIHSAAQAVHVGFWSTG